MEFYTDQDLLKGCISGDSQAQESFVRMFSGLVYKSVRYTLKSKNFAHTQSDVEDLHNTVFVKLFEKGCRKLGQYTGKNNCSIGNWLRVVTVRVVIDHMRRTNTDALTREGKTLSLDAVAELKEDIPDPLTLMGKKEQFQLLNKALQALLPRDRLFLKLHFFEGMSIQEVAKTLELSEANAHAVKSRAIQRLRYKVMEYAKIDSP
jgi:RNA polymerase sigma factor (sigma-70 family)